MIVTLAIIMSVMILVLAVLTAGVAVLALDNIKERDQLRAIRIALEQARATPLENQTKIDDPMKRYNDIVNDHL